MDINIPANINLEQYNSSLAECIKRVVNFHGTDYHNICDGSITYVQNGLIDYFLICTLIGLLAFLGIILIALLTFWIKEEIL